MISNLYIQIELRFWDYVIQQLSRSQKLRQVLRTVAPLATPEFKRWLAPRAGIVAGSGFITGMIGFLIIVK